MRCGHADKLRENFSLRHLTATHVALARLVVDPLGRLPHVDAALSCGVVNHLLALVPDLLHLVLEILRLTLAQREVCEDRRDLRLERGRLQHARLVELELITRPAYAWRPCPPRLAR